MNELIEAFGIEMAARERGIRQDLKESVLAAVRRWRDPDREWSLKNPNSTLNLLAEEFSALTDAALSDCLEAVKRYDGHSEQQIRIQAILDWGKKNLPPMPAKAKTARRAEW